MLVSIKRYLIGSQLGKKLIPLIDDDLFDAMVRDRSSSSVSFVAVAFRGNGAPFALDYARGTAGIEGAF